MRKNRGSVSRYTWAAVSWPISPETAAARLDRLARCRTCPAAPDGTGRPSQCSMLTGTSVSRARPTAAGWTARPAAGTGNRACSRPGAAGAVSRRRRSRRPAGMVRAGKHGGDPADLPVACLGRRCSSTEVSPRSAGSGATRAGASAACPGQEGAQLARPAGQGEGGAGTGRRRAPGRTRAGAEVFPTLGSRYRAGVEGDDAGASALPGRAGRKIPLRCAVRPRGRPR